MRFLELQDALDRLLPKHREALMLVARRDFLTRTRQRFAHARSVTMKSRVSRARARLAVLLAVREHAARKPLCYALRAGKRRWRPIRMAHSHADGARRQCVVV